MYANLLKNWQDMTYCELPTPKSEPARRSCA